MISRLDLVNDLLSIYWIFDVFRSPFWGRFWDKYVKKWSMEKESKKELKKVMQASHRLGGQRQRRGPAEGADLSRLRRVPAAEIETES